MKLDQYSLTDMIIVYTFYCFKYWLFKMLIILNAQCLQETFLKAFFYYLQDNEDYGIPTQK